MQLISLLLLITASATFAQSPKPHAANAASCRQVLRAVLKNSKSSQEISARQAVTLNLVTNRLFETTNAYEAHSEGDAVYYHLMLNLTQIASTSYDQIRAVQVPRLALEGELDELEVQARHCFDDPGSKQ